MKEVPKIVREFLGTSRTESAVDTLGGETAERKEKVWENLVGRCCLFLGQ